MLLQLYSLRPLMIEQVQDGDEGQEVDSRVEDHRIHYKEDFETIAIAE